MPNKKDDTPLKLNGMMPVPGMFGGAMAMPSSLSNVLIGAQAGAVNRRPMIGTPEDIARFEARHAGTTEAERLASVNYGNMGGPIMKKIDFSTPASGAQAMVDAGMKKDNFVYWFCRSHCSSC